MVTVTFKVYLKAHTPIVHMNFKDDLKKMYEKGVNILVASTYAGKNMVWKYILTLKNIKNSLWLLL